MNRFKNELNAITEFGLNFSFTENLYKLKNFHIYLSLNVDRLDSFVILVNINKFNQ